MRLLQEAISLGMIIGFVLMVAGALAITSGATRAAGGGISGYDLTAAATVIIGAIAFILSSVIGAIAFIVRSK